jgi:hypothetical protein
MPTLDQIIDEPQTLFGLFPDSDDSDDDETNDAPVSLDDKAPNGQQRLLDCSSNGYHYEIQSLVVANETLRIRQFAYHSHNANRVWPGTFNLANYLLETVPLTVEASSSLLNSMDDIATSSATCRTNYRYKHYWGRVLELGTATGILAIRLAMASAASQHTVFDQTSITAATNSALSSSDAKNHAAASLEDSSSPGVAAAAALTDTVQQQDGYSHCCTSVVTSDVVDDHQDIATNVAYNCALNSQSSLQPSLVHVPHTWGTGWVASCREACKSAAAASASVTTADPSTRHAALGSSGYEALLDANGTCMGFDTIVASDILLYVAAYPALVATLLELVRLPLRPETSCISPARIPNGDEETLAFGTPPQQRRGTVIVLSWNRRMKESQEFFERMERAGFTCTHQGQCIYTFVFRGRVEIRSSQ